MPKDADAIATIDASFTTLVRFLQELADDTEAFTAFNSEVEQLLNKEGRTVIGYKKTLRFMMNNFAQRCGLVIRDKATDEESGLFIEFGKEVCYATASNRTRVACPLCKRVSPFLCHDVVFCFFWSTVVDTAVQLNRHGVNYRARLTRNAFCTQAISPVTHKISLPTLMTRILKDVANKCTISKRSSRSKETRSHDDAASSRKKQKRPDCTNLLLWFGYPPSLDIRELSYSVLHKRTLKLQNHYHPDKSNGNSELCSLLNMVSTCLPTNVLAPNVLTWPNLIAAFGQMDDFLKEHWDEYVLSRTDPHFVSSTASYPSKYSNLMATLKKWDCVDYPDMSNMQTTPKSGPSTSTPTSSQLAEVELSLADLDFVKTLDDIKVKSHTRTF